MAESAIVAKIEHSFSMSVSPERAQEMFVRDIAPDLHRDQGFTLYEQKPGHLAFSDGVVDPFLGIHDETTYSGLRRLTARRIRVEFAAEPTGTRVLMSGHAERDLSDALTRLGLPGHWPETADQPHD